MARYQWVRVRRGSPCPICRHVDHCTHSADGTVVRCTRVTSDKESRGSDGVVAWLHRLGETKRLAPVVREEKERPDINWPAEATKMFRSSRAKWIRSEVAKQLGVSEESLYDLRVGWGSDSDEFAAFPARDASGRVIGITRRYLDGTKKTMRYGSGGLFYPRDWATRTAGPVFIAEGASDVAALMTMGLCGIGRHSNTSSTHLGKLLSKCKRPIVVLAERDEKPDRRTGVPPGCEKTCRYCNTCYPGLYGAIRVANELSKQLRRKIEVKFCPSGAKDVRGWLNASSAGESFLEMVWQNDCRVVQ